MYKRQERLRRESLHSRCAQAIVYSRLHRLSGAQEAPDLGLDARSSSLQVEEPERTRGDDPKRGAVRKHVVHEHSFTRLQDALLQRWNINRAWMLQRVIRGEARTDVSVERIAPPFDGAEFSFQRRDCRFARA